MSGKLQVHLSKSKPSRPKASQCFGLRIRRLLLPKSPTSKFTTSALQIEQDFRGLDSNNRLRPVMVTNDSFHGKRFCCNLVDALTGVNKTHKPSTDTKLALAARSSKSDKPITRLLYQTVLYGKANATTTRPNTYFNVLYFAA